MTGNGKHTTFENGDDWGMVYCFIHLNNTNNTVFTTINSGANKQKQ